MAEVVSHCCLNAQQSCNRWASSISKSRQCTPGERLISPPSHCDSPPPVKGLDQLIHFPEDVNPNGKVLMGEDYEIGLGVVVAGAAKAKVDCITVPGQCCRIGVAVRSVCPCSVFRDVVCLISRPTFVEVSSRFA